jgi:hypothetical protein
MAEWRHQPSYTSPAVADTNLPTLPRLLQTSQEHKLAWLAQIRLARLAYATVQDDDTPKGADAEANETTHAQ